MIPFLNASLIRRRPAMVMDHGQLVPDPDNTETTLVGVFNVQPRSSAEDNVHALAVDTELVAVGALGIDLASTDEVDVVFNSGRALRGLAITADPLRWEGPGALAGLSHTVVQLKHRAQDEEVQ